MTTKAQPKQRSRNSGKLIVRCGILENRIDWLNRIMRDEYPENQTRIMRLIIKNRKKLLIIERLLSREYRT